MRDLDVRETVSALEKAGISVCLDGGWGVDALAGCQTRAHSDLDLAIDESRLNDAASALEAMGYRYDETAFPGLPARFVMRDQTGRQVDFRPLRFDDAGNGWQKLSDGDAWGCYPDGASTSGVVAGLPVACISPDLQHRFHLGWEWDDRAWHDMRLLHERFGTPLPPAGR